MAVLDDHHHRDPFDRMLVAQALVEDLVFSATPLVFFGAVGLMVRRNPLVMFMCVELMLNAANINFVAFSRYVQHGIDGQIMAAFVIVLAAAEAAVGLAIIISIFRSNRPSICRILVSKPVMLSWRESCLKLT